MKQLTLRQLNRLDDKPLFSVRDPISALTHFIGFLAAIILTPLLLAKTCTKLSSLDRFAAYSIYCLSMITLYGASSAYHAFLLPQTPSRVLKKLDHMSIFLLIAGSYTPICVCALNRSDGITLLITVWIIALAGILLKAFWVYCPRYVSSIIYIAMGWVALFKIRAVFTALSPAGFYWLIAGGAMYTAGGIIYALKFSLNKDWGAHELFHLLVLAGSACHYVMMLLYV